MQPNMMVFIAVIAASFACGYVWRKVVAKRRRKDAESEASRILAEATKQAAHIANEADLAAKALEFRLRAEFDTQTRTRREDLDTLEHRLRERSEMLDRKFEILDKKERALIEREDGVMRREQAAAGRQEEVERLLEQERATLQQLSHLTEEEARQRLLQRVEQESRTDVAKFVQRLEEDTRRDADDKARRILATAIQRCAPEHVMSNTVCVIQLPGDDMKGRVIGKDGRNIRSFEAETGVDVVIDETPETIVLSSFDAVRREVARIAMERLIADGRIHPSRIEEEVRRAREDLEVMIRDEGERACHELGVEGVHQELKRRIGLMKYRASHGQNILAHLKEVATLMGIVASELGLDAPLARRIGLLHDIGKSAEGDADGPHAELGAELARKYGESEEVALAIAGHHAETGEQTVFAALAQACDAVSAMRPGARRESLEHYVRRLERVEELVDAFPEVDKAYAIQAGREVRVIVYPERVEESQLTLLARNIAKHISEELEFPGQIKVTLIRETRAVDYAK